MKFRYAVCFALLSLASCNQTPKIDALSQKELDELSVKSGDLKVIFHSPKGDSDGSKKITVSFDQPMIALDSYQKVVSDAPLEIQPKVAGSYRWLGSRTLQFVPDAVLPHATEFVAKVPSGTESLLKKKLPEDYVFRFSSSRPKIEKISPVRGAVRQSAQVVSYVYFNQDVSPQNLEKSLHVKAWDTDGTGTNWPVKIEKFSAKELELNKETADANFKGKLKIIPQKPYPLDAKITIDIDETLKGNDGVLPMGKAYSSEFTIHSHFAISGLSCTQECYPGSLPEILVTSSPDEMKFAQSLKIEPPVPGEINCYYASYNGSMVCSAKTDSNTNYTITVPKGIKDVFGQALVEDYKAGFKTGSFSPAFYFTGGNGVLEADGSRDYYAHSLNVNELSVRIAEVPENMLAKKAFNYFENAGIADPLEGMPLLSDEIQKLKFKKDILNGVGIPLTNIKKGTFVILDVSTPDIQIYDQLSKLNKPTHNAALLQVTNLGLSAKWSPKNSLVWVTQLSDAKPVSDAEVSIINEKGQIVWTGMTDKKGLAMAPGIAELDAAGKKDSVASDDEVNEEDLGAYEYEGEVTRYLVLAKTDDDKAFALSSWNDGFNVWEFGYSEDYSYKARQFRTFIFTERGVYRPGEKVHVKGIVRELTNALPVVAKENGELKVINSKGVEVLKKEITLNDFGSFTQDLDLPADAVAGNYSITYSTKNDDVETRGAGDFLVEYYRPQEFKVSLKNANEDLVKGQSLTGLVSAEYLFGAPMKGRDVSWSVHYSISSFVPPNQPVGYSWQKAYEEKRLTSWIGEYNHVANGKGKSDEKGQYTLSLPIENEDSFVEPRNYTWEATVEDINHQSISDKAIVTVHPASIYLGIKQASYFAESGTLVKSGIRAATIDGKIQEGVDVTATWKKIEWKSVRKEGFRGVFTYSSERSVSKIKTCQLKTAKEDVNCEFTPETPGLYLLTANSEDENANGVYASSAIYVSGKGFGGWKLEDSHQLTLKKDKDVYVPGDIAKVMVQSPYEHGYALITQERGGIISKQVKEVNGYSPTLDIPIVKEQIPNTFVSVMLVNGRISPVPAGNEDDRGKPSVHVGLINLPVESNELSLQVSAKTDKSIYVPGEESTLSFKVEDASGAPLKNTELTVMVVDQGVLRLTGYTLPDPMAYFYSEQGLAVSSIDSRIYLVGKRALAAKMDSEAAGGGSDVNFRSKFVPTAYWNPSIITNEKGEAQVKFKLPDNLTTFSVMAVALGGQNQFGSANAEFKTKKDFMIRPALPRFGRTTDQIKVGAVVHNESDQMISVDLSASFSGAEYNGDESQSIKVDAHSVKRVNYDLKVQNAKEIEVRFSGKSNNGDDAINFKIPVSYPKLLEHRLFAGSTQEATQEFIKKPQNVYEDVGGLDISVASTPLVGFGDEMKQLNIYPYDCLEQKVSKIYPLLISEKLMNDFDLLSTDNWKSKIERFLDNLSETQLYDGGFKYWPDSWYADFYLTAYVGSFVADSMSAGYKVNQYLVDKLVKYLQTELARSRQPNQELTVDEKLYMVKALIQLGQPAGNWLDTLYDFRDGLSIAARSQLVLLMHQLNDQDTRIAPELKRIENAIVLSGNEASIDDTAFSNVYVNNSNRRSTAAVLDMLLTLNPNHVMIEKLLTWLVKSYNPNMWISTQESIAVLRAIAHYHQVKELNKPNLSYLVQKGTQSLLQGEFVDYELKKTNVSVPLSSLAPEETLAFSKKGTGELFYTADLNYARKSHLFSIDNGMTISKRYEDNTGKEVSKFATGNLYKVIVSLVFETDSFNVAVDDPVAAGFEPVNPNLRGASQMGMTLAKSQTVSENFPFDYLVSHSEKQDDRVLVFADYVPAGSYEYTYFVRATTSGQYNVPASRVGEMYIPDNFGQSVSGHVIINEE